MRPPNQHCLTKRSRLGITKGSVMTWRLLIALIGLSMTDVNSFAQSDPTDRETPQAEGLDRPNAHAGYLGPSGVVRFQLIQGRICLDAPRHRKGSQSCNKNGIYESVSVTAQRGIPSVHYVSQTQYRHLTLSVQDANRMRIESWLPSQGERCVIVQLSSGPITLSCTSGNQSHQWTGATLIHVRGLHPTLFDKHFGRLMTRMLHGQSLEELSEKTRSAVVAELHRPMRITETEIHQWIADLGSDQRRLRIEAQRNLMDGGTLVVSTLRGRLVANTKKGDLDVEQIARMDRILNQLRSRSPDRPRSLAKLLVNDPSYWTIVSGSLTSDQRQLAVSRQHGFRQLPASVRPVIRIAGRRP